MPSLEGCWSTSAAPFAAESQSSPTPGARPGRRRRTPCVGWSGTCTTARSSDSSGWEWTSPALSGGWRQTDPAKAKLLLDEAFEQSQEALSEIRQLSRGIAPPILAEQGLPAAITALAARNGIPTTVDVGNVTLNDAAQNAAYFVVAEALTNMEKHSAATRCRVEIHQVGGIVVLAVTDDGVGGASLSRGHGLAGLGDRLAGVDGTLTVTSPAGGPTQITATIPAFAA